MLDVGHALLAACERDPDAEALVDGDRRFTYGALWTAACGVAAGLEGVGLARGAHLVTVLQNRWEAAVLHWACQLAGVIVTPINWRATAEEVDYVLDDANARAVVYEPVSAAAVAHAPAAAFLPRIGVGLDASEGLLPFESLFATDGGGFRPRARADDFSVMLYTSGTTGRPKGVPRRHRAERAAAVAHVAQNRYGHGERTLGVMPLYHTMGVRSLLAMALIDGCFVCQPRFEPGTALALIAAEKLTNLYLVPTLYHDLISHPDFENTDIASVRKLGFAGAAMTDGLLRRLAVAFRPELFVNHYGSSEIYTFTIAPDAPSKPGSAGKPGLNQRVRVVRLGSGDPDDRAPVGEEGEIVADLASDEAFDGYWRRPDADQKALRAGWYFTGDTGHVDGDGDLFVTGRVDDLIISGGENVSPAEIESRLSLHPAVAEVAVAGLPDARWGHVVTAFVKAREPVTPEALDAHCRDGTLANYKRPRRYVFVKEVPKSPVGKILRRLLVAGEYEAATPANIETSEEQKGQSAP